ncbi:hypothetical protein DAPPUDRAFT_248406 [Daphnia pulex]|uniref:Uncharacterized protein n=1 Tax=Daphnia pulex TaxID=6669 RepID=E9GUL4_DAPPU|nr:hypothetical protein DAPPUDRAFT_248406 [Daphnia pulex]|eukprot:EFX76913.1 hypothetical protein DAPPUDRAFT_248406 [Daphnia pulex]
MDRRRCRCGVERCTNRGVEHFQDAEEEVEIAPAAMDPNVLNALLAALAANQQQQQQQFQLQQQQMQQQQAYQQQMQQQFRLQQDVVTALANRLLAAPSPAQVVVPAPAPAVPVAAVRAALDPEAGRIFMEDTVQLTEGQWQAMVEGRRQLPNESGSTYVLEKVKLCRRRATPLTDAELIPFLIRGLLHPEMRSAMMCIPPISVNAFLIEIRRLESISYSLLTDSSASKETEKIDEKIPEKTRSTDSLF